MSIEFVINHLWQSSCFVLLAALLAFVLRKNSPKVRYWVWLSASLKFLVPFALLVSLGSVVPRPARRPLSTTAPVFPNTLVQVAEPISLSPHYAADSARAPLHWVPIAIGIAWALGFLAITLARFRSWLAVQAALQGGTPVELPIPVRVFLTPGIEEPGIIGFLQPVLILPAHLIEWLNPRQLDAVLAHELCHVRRRDNLFAAVHMAVEAIFWFHPLVWWIGSRMVEERELACDEDVLRAGNEPADYVEGILKVCRFYKESPLPCVAGVTGADIKKRLRAILAGSVARELTIRKKVILAAAGLAALAAPIAVGMLSAPHARAQSDAESSPPSKVVKPLVAQVAPAKDGQSARQVAQPIAEPLQFEVASVKPAAGGEMGGVYTYPGGRIELRGCTLHYMIEQAFNLQPFQVSGGPGWMQSDRFDVDAKPPASSQSIHSMPPYRKAPMNDEQRQMLQSLLIERFQLKVHRESREGPVYLLERGSKPLKLTDSKDKNEYPWAGSIAGGALSGDGLAGINESMDDLARRLSPYLERPVLNRTEIAGSFDFKVPYESTDARPDRIAMIFTTVQELGLKLQTSRGPIETIVIERVEKPSAN